ncbi:MAG TPA: DUF4912 domain-containing protein, partial [Pyrinomonadaceae bacterium]|nr:DUF4912 domain-containing protein [Pyrinomonadaceae bacterium]
DDMLEETSAPDAGSAPAAAHATPANTRDTLDDMLPVVLKRDFIQLLLQSPYKLYLYWTFARDPHTVLREAFGELAAQYRLAVRLIKVESGEEFLFDAPRERAQWFDVYPRHVYRAEVGFRAEARPFVRLLSSNTVTTPPDRASHLSDASREFQLEANEFAQLLGGAGYERYARALTADAGGVGINVEEGGAVVTVEGEGACVHVSREAADEYPHR